LHQNNIRGPMGSHPPPIVTHIVDSLSPFWLKCCFGHQDVCCNPSFGLVTKAKGLQGCGPRENPGITSHTPRSVKKCERVNLHTPKAIPILGDGVLRQKDIWMWAPWRGVEYIIKGKVVASPKSGPWWILCVRVAHGSS